MSKNIGGLANEGWGKLLRSIGFILLVSGTLGFAASGEELAREKTDYTLAGGFAAAGFFLVGGGYLTHRRSKFYLP